MRVLTEEIRRAGNRLAWSRKYVGLVIGIVAAGFSPTGFPGTPSAADRVFLGDTPGIPLAASANPGTIHTINVLRKQASKSGTTRVIVGVRAAFAPEGLMAATSITQQRNEIATTQSAVLNRVPTLKNKTKSTKRFETIPFMATEVDPAELEALVNLPEITSIEEDQLAAPTLAESSPLIGAATAWSSGYTGAGQTIAILDTGVDKTHSFLTGKVVSEACYSSNYAPHSATSVCPGAVTQSTAIDSALPYAGTCPAGECDHGTHVAGIAAGLGGGFSGVAKGASLIAIQVFSRFDSAASCGSAATPCARTYSSDQLLGLERVYALRGSYNIAAVNMSLGGGQYFDQATCDSANPATKTAIDNLRSANIATVISSGNDGYTSSMGSPGCISSAISVGSTWDAAGYGNNGNGNNLGTSSIDEIACYSNSTTFINLLAPGSLINSSIPGGGYAAWHGTSMAAPQVAGAWAVLKHKNSSLTVNNALTILTSTGVQVTDSRNGIATSRIQVDAALNAIGAAGTPPATPTIGTATAGNASISVAFTPGALGTGTLVNYTADCGGIANTGASSPITVAGLNNGTTYTCKVKTTTTVGASPWSALSNAVTPLAPEEGFPGGGIPAGWVQPGGSNASWVVAADSSYGGSTSLKSGIIGNSQKSDIAYTAIFTGGGTVSFARKVSSELNYDYLEFYIDGVLQNTWSGEVPWSVVSFTITAGSHTLMWRYIKDSSVISGSDSAWIDSVTLPPLLSPPVCSMIPVSPSMYVGAAQLFTASCTNSPTSYQWAVDGVNIGGATQSSFITTQPLGAHTVSVTATNAAGSGSISIPVTVNVFVPPSMQQYLVPILKHLILD